MKELESSKLLDNKKKVEQAVEFKMKSYCFLEQRVYKAHLMCLVLSAFLLILGFLYPVMHYVQFEYMSDLSQYYGYIFILMSLVVNAARNEFFSKFKRTELSLLNNMVSSLYDDYLIREISIWELKSGVDELIGYYLNNSRNVFLNYHRY
ncbi:TPA: hypothetical protein NJ727_003073 [Vibrio parahaemolyticus]|nr:hypothetical protein [Vibrio parahaemolyticus]HCG9794292.1 hypothetical protein [Vibrio parahaemolyticus]